jgi:CheY-like chemotaxis protein
VTSESVEGLRILVVEDESLVTMLIEDTLADLGCDVVDKASRLEEAVEKAAKLEFDVAILDVNLNGQHTTAVAEILSKRGIPFLFATGYGVAGVPDAFRTSPLLHKPFARADMVRALSAAVGRGDQTKA